MKRKTVKKITQSRYFYMIISVFAAVVLWLYVANVENNIIEKPINGIPVQFKGENEIFADRNLMLTKETNQKVSLTLMGRRSELAQLNSANITLTADLTSITATGTHSLLYTVGYPTGVDSSGITILTSNPSYVTVAVDKMSSKKVELRGVFAGSVAKGYKAGEFEFSPSAVVIKGAKEEIARVTYAQVTLERSNISETVTATLDYTLMDKDDIEVDSKNIKKETDTVNVTYEVMLVKEIGLSVEFIEGGGATAGNVTYHIEPKTITLSGDSEVLNPINQITLGTIDLSQVSTSTVVLFSILIPNDVENLTGAVEAEVSVEITGLVSKPFTTKNIEMKNITAGYTATPVTQEVDVLIRGPKQIIDLITEYNIRVVADLSELGQATGSFTVPASVFVDGYKEAGAVGKYSIVVNLTKGTPQPSPADGAT